MPNASIELIEWLLLHVEQYMMPVCLLENATGQALADSVEERKLKAKERAAGYK